MKIIFELDCEDGFPPIQYEKLNAEQISKNQFKIVNTPFFIDEVSYGDIVVALETDNEEQFEFLCVEKNASFTSISIIILDSSVDDELKDIFTGFNCVMEYGEFGNLRIFAVAIPTSSPYKQIASQLDDLETAAKISYSELAIAHQ
ncbi:MAG: DUF4265 domain-containing protein [Algicola sp.]|nr:DUF4265 domain-containing protein [Algicola sp.]